MAGRTFDSLMVISRESADAGTFDVAYHALAAAMHAAEAAKDLVALDHVLDQCVAQDAMLEGISPPHHLSTKGAQKRHTVPLYKSLRATIESTRTRIVMELGS